MFTPDDLAQLVRQRTWDKELNVWVGSEHQLLSVLDGVQTEILDLLDLFDPNQVPIEDDDVRQHLSRALRQKLKTIPRPSGRRMVLIVRSAGLLARYNVGVSEFYNWFCDDFSMVFLLIEGRCAESHWPPEVDCHPDRLIDFFGVATQIKRQFGGP
jgi:hypothetical protein